MDQSAIEDGISLMQRYDVLEACRDGPVGRTGVAERADCSRSTAYRATRQLSEERLLERSNGGYELTGAGAAALDHARQFTAQLAGTTQIQPLFEYVDHPELVENAHLFRDAELVTQEASSAYRIENRVKQIIEATETEMIGMTTGLGSPALADAMIERIRDGVRVDWVLPSGTYEEFNSAHGELSAQAVTDGQTTVSVRESIPIDLAVYDETLVAIGFDHERGVLGTVAVTDDPAAVQWAREVFEDCQRAAERVE